MWEILTPHFDQWTDHPEQMMLEQIELIEYSIEKQQNIHPSQVHVEHSPGLITCWDHKVSLSKIRKIEMISSNFSNDNTMKLEINYNKKIKKHKRVA